MKDLQLYLPVKPGAETQFHNAGSRMRTSNAEGEDGYLPALFPHWFESKIAGILNDEVPVLGTDPRFLKTLQNSSTLTYVTESTTSPGGHLFTTKGPPTAADEMMLSAVRGVLVAGTPSNGSSPNASNCYHFSTQLQVSSVAATGLGFVAGWLPPSASVTPLTTAPANGIYFYMTAGGSALHLATVQNSGAANLLSLFNPSNGASPTAATFTLVAATDYRFTIQFGQSPNGNMWGKVHAAPVTPGSMGWSTNLTAAQLTDIAAMITAGNVFLSGFIGFNVASTTQRTANVQYMAAICDR